MLNGKSTISMSMFNSELWNYQRVEHTWKYDTVYTLKHVDEKIGGMNLLNREAAKMMT